MISQLTLEQLGEYETLTLRGSLHITLQSALIPAGVNSQIQATMDPVSAILLERIHTALICVI